MHKNIFLCCCFIVSASISFAQTSLPVYYKGAVKEKKQALRRNIVQNTITNNLSFPLNTDTEEYWMDAFGGMELLFYKSPWADGRINIAFDSLEKRSTGFQRALLELAYTNYPGRFVKQARSLQLSTADAKVFAMATEYLALNNKTPLSGIDTWLKKTQLVKTVKDDAILLQLFNRFAPVEQSVNNISLASITDTGFLPGRAILYSFQRKNRNYPGIAMIRDTAGNFVLNESGSTFAVPQLARSINNLPGYLTNGNTPQGLFRMYGFDTSKSGFIGPTTNIQLTMPGETSLQHFFNDSTITDTAWTIEWYKQLLPGNLKNYRALYESFYAGRAGRTEIIAHGTTVDPEYYAGQTYYPQTPTMGCLCTKEIWSETDGKRLESDQARLVAALQKAGGANGYSVVIEIDDAERAVSLADILPFIKPSQLK